MLQFRNQLDWRSAMTYVVLTPIVLWVVLVVSELSSMHIIGLLYLELCTTVSRNIESTMSSEAEHKILHKYMNDKLNRYIC